MNIIRKLLSLATTMEDFIKMLSAFEIVVRRDGMKVLYVTSLDEAVEIVDCLTETYGTDIDGSDIWQKDGTLKIIIM